MWQSEVSQSYEILIPSRSNPYRSLTSPGGTNPPGKEAFMLDFVFVALGFAVIASAGKPAIYMPPIFRAVVPNLASICGIAQ